MILEFDGKTPSLGKDVFLAPDAWLIGDVSLGDQVSVFFGAVLRGDLLAIQVGSGTNIQEHCLLHTTHGRSPTIVGQNCTIGHKAILHGCSVGDSSLIGMGATVLDDSVIGEESLVGAGSLVTEGKTFPPRSLILGSPAKVVRTLSEQECAQIKKSSAAYVRTGKEFAKLLA